MSARQATVECWGVGGGTARADDGTRFVLPLGLPASSGLRTLRRGQRVQLELSGDTVVGLRLPGP